MVRTVSVIKKPQSKMDSRCPRKLTDFPDMYCPLAVLRLKALRNAGGELTEQEESRLQGCPFSVSHQLSCYCFFKYMEFYYPNKPLADIEIAHYNSVSVDTVKKMSQQAITKLQQLDDFTEIANTYGDDCIIENIDE